MKTVLIQWVLFTLILVLFQEYLIHYFSSAPAFWHVPAIFIGLTYGFLFSFISGLPILFSTSVVAKIISYSLMLIFSFITIDPVGISY